jgi:nucleoside-diphosphate-sugar epimerase
MRILVTGATGFVGKEIVAELLKKNYDVFCLGSSKSKNSDNLPNFLKADVGDSENLEKIEELKNIDVIIHSAGLAHQFGEVKKEDFWKVNVEGTRNVVALAAKVKAKQFILISSVAVYGKSRRQKKQIAVDEDFECEPEGFYAQSKLESEKIAREICEKDEKEQIPLTILRLATVIGENDRGNTARLAKMIDKGKFFWIGKGENYKSLIYKNDVARACLSVLDKKTNETEIFNVTAEPVSMKEIVSEIALQLNRKIPKIYIPGGLLQKTFRAGAKISRIKKISKVSETVEKWLSDDIFSGEKIAFEYGFRAETSIREALGRQVEAYIKNQKKRKNQK